MEKVNRKESFRALLTGMPTRGKLTARDHRKGANLGPRHRWRSGKPGGNKPSGEKIFEKEKLVHKGRNVEPPLG